MEAFFHSLWQKSALGRSAEVNIPHTVIFKEGVPTDWYFFSQKVGFILKKSAAITTMIKIEETFCKKHSSSQIYAKFLYTERNISVFLDAQGLHDFLFPGNTCLKQIQTKTGVLQKFIEPRSSYNEVIQVSWTPNLIRLIRQRPIYKVMQMESNPASRKHGEVYKVATFESNRQLSKNTPVSGSALHNLVDNMCKTISLHIYELSQGQSHTQSLTLYLKVDSNDNLALLYPEKLQISSSSASNPSLHAFQNKMRLIDECSPEELDFLQQKASFCCVSCGEPQTSPCQHEITLKAIKMHFEKVVKPLIKEVLSLIEIENSNFIAEPDDVLQIKDNLPRAAEFWEVHTNRAGIHPLANWIRQGLLISAEKSCLSKAKPVKNFAQVFNEVVSAYNLHKTPPLTASLTGDDLATSKSTSHTPHEPVKVCDKCLVEFCDIQAEFIRDGAIIPDFEDKSYKTRLREVSQIREKVKFQRKRSIEEHIKRNITVEHLEQEEGKLYVRSQHRLDMPSPPVLDDILKQSDSKVKVESNISHELKEKLRSREKKFWLELFKPSSKNKVNKENREIVSLIKSYFSESKVEESEDVSPYLIATASQISNTVTSCSAKVSDSTLLNPSIGLLSQTKS